MNCTRSSFFKGALLSALIAFPVCLCGAAEAAWKAGAAKTRITPEEPIWMSGYASRVHPSEGTRTALWAKAVALEDAAGERAVVITLDLVGIHRDLSKRICEAIMGAHRIQRSHILINTSHTHTGPVVGSNLRTMYFLSDAEGVKVDSYSRALETKIVATADKAFRSLAPAVLSFAEGQAMFATNRRNNPEAKVAEWRALGNLRGPADYRVPVLRIADDQGGVKAILFGYACHATTLDDYLWSGDYPGFAQRMIEEKYPGATALFWAGCGADINPLPRRTPELAEEYGSYLAEAVHRAMRGVFAGVDPEIECTYEEIDLPFDKIPSRSELETDSENENRYIAARAKMLIGKLDRGESLASNYPYPISVWRLGKNLNWVGLGGEVVVDYALRLQRELGPGSTWVAGYSHDVMAYIPSRRVWEEGGYEGGGAMVYYGLPSRWAGNVEEIIVNQVKKQATRVSNSR